MMATVKIGRRTTYSNKFIGHSARDVTNFNLETMDEQNSVVQSPDTLHGESDETAGNQGHDGKTLSPAKGDNCKKLTVPDSTTFTVTNVTVVSDGANEVDTEPVLRYHDPRDPKDERGLDGLDGLCISESKQVSPITIQIGDNSIDTGAILVTMEGSHYIRHNAGFFSQLKIRSDDRVFMINGACVENWDHVVVHNCLTYLMASTLEEVTMVIKRRNRDNSEDVLIYTVALEFAARGKTSSMVNLAVSVVKQKLFPPPPITGVEFQGKQKCWIKVVSLGQYLHVDGDDVDLRPLDSFKDASFQFMRYTFSAVECVQRTAECVFICVFGDKASGRYLCCVRGQPKLKLCTEKLRLSIECVKTPDPRFFLLHQTSDGRSYLESMVYRGYQLGWDNLKSALTLQDCSQLQAFPGTFPNGEFDVVTSKEVLRSESLV